MPNDISPRDPGRFGLESFAQVLPERDPITGEDPGSFDGFHEGMMRSLAPLTPYECVIAENLVAIEWELLQHRRMRDACLRQTIRGAIRDAVVAQRKAAHEDALDEAWDRFIEEGGDEDDWEEPVTFDGEAAERAGDDLATRAISHDRDVQATAYAEIAELGQDSVEVMSAAYRDFPSPAKRHDAQIQDLERRRRDVKRDYDALQAARPLDGAVIEG